MGCTNLAVPAEVMHHVVRVESSYNPYAIGVVGGRLARQPRSLPEAVATAQMLESRGYNFSLGLAQVNRYNLRKYGLDTYERAFGKCANLSAGASILAECHSRSKGDWGNAFSCYYSGNFVTGYRHGYVQKVFASMGSARDEAPQAVEPIGVIERVPAAPSRAAVSPGTDGSNVASQQRAANPLVALRSTPTAVSRSQFVRESVQDIAATASMPVLPSAAAETLRSANLNDTRVPARAVTAEPAVASGQPAQQEEGLPDSAFVF